MRPQQTPSTIMTALAFVCLLAGGAAAEQSGDRPAPERGQHIMSMGRPHQTRYFVSGEIGLKPIEDREFVGTLAFGFDRTLGNPMVPALGISAEYFMGISGQATGEVGVRAGLESPVLRFGGGAQYEFRENQTRGFLSFRHPIKRGGIFWRGAQIRVLWFPGTEQSLRAGVTVPLGQPFAGRTRPVDSRASVPRPVADEPPRIEAPGPATQAALDRLSAAAARLHRFIVPYIDHDARSREGSVSAFTSSMKSLAEELESTGAPPTGPSPAGAAEPAPLRAAREFRTALAEAFESAGSGGRGGEALTQAACEALLNELILPYNRLLGRRKDGRVFDELAARARVEFSRRAVLRDGGGENGIREAETVFAKVVEIMRDVAESTREDYDDGRMVFLPLQYALVPEEHDTQEEMDALVARAVGQPFSIGNEVWYVVSEQFQYELLRMINAARLYHVLWIHDIRGFDDFDEPDAVTYRIILDGYLNALAERLEAYDREGVLPVYMIFIDEWYYEARKDALWLKVIEDPLRCGIDLPKGFEEWEDEIRKAQERLRDAVAASHLLRTQAREYGEDWLYSRVRVQVNVTNPADNTFWTREAVPWIGLRDDLIRDHRKIAFYDVNPLEPWRGMALYTGMGVGEHYTGSTWDDRAIRVRGPALLSLRRQARELLLQQGFAPDDIPYPLQDEHGDPWDRGFTAVQRPEDATRAARFAPPPADERRDDSGCVGAPESRVMETHNQVGYGPKLATVAKATLYSLMPPGGVIKAPDSIWNNPLWASLLLGYAIRGGRALVIAPTFQTAPARSSIALSRAEEVLGRLILAGDILAGPLEESGGLIKVGLYDPEVGVADIPGKARQFVRTHEETAWLRDLCSFAPGVLEGVRALADSMHAAGFSARYLEGEPLDNPRLHMKAQYMSSSSGWDSLLSRPEFGDFFEQYLRERAVQVAERGQDRDLAAMTSNLLPHLLKLRGACEKSLRDEERREALWFLTVGSQNQNNRSMALDGEVLVIVSGPDAQIALADFVLLTGLTKWIDTMEELDRYLPPSGGFKRRLSRWLEIGA